MKALRVQSLILVAAIVELTVVNLIFVQPAKAGCGWLDITCKNSGIRRTGRQVDPTNPNFDTRQILRENDPRSPAFVVDYWCH